MGKTIRIVLELSAEAEDGDGAALWHDMKNDFKTDPQHRLILETRNWFANVKPIAEEKTDV